MMNGTTRNIRSEFERVANLYLQELCKLFGLDAYYGDWVGDEVGGLYCNGETFMISFDEMRVVVDNQMKLADYVEYMEYCQWANEFDIVAPNLMSWIKGCPRHSKETMQILRDLKHEYDIALAAYHQARIRL